MQLLGTALLFLIVTLSEIVNVFVICVPTGVTSSHEPDLFPLKSACFVVGSNLKKGDLVIFESTVSLVQLMKYVFLSLKSILV